MSDAASVDAFFSRAKEREKAYDWLEAAEFYKTALGHVPVTDFFKIGQIQERTGYAFYRAAMQAESVNQFRERMPEAVARYERAKELYGRLSEPRKTPFILRCDAMIACLGYWLTSEVSEKKRLLNECWKTTKETLRAFKEARDTLEYGKTYNQLCWSVWFSLPFEEDSQVCENTTEEGVEHGEQAIRFLSACGDSHELARAFVNTASFLELLGDVFHDLDKREEYSQKARNYWQKANELSEEVSFLEASIDLLLFAWGVGTDKAQKNLEKALGYARRTKDRLRVGRVLEMLTHQTAWTSSARDHDEAMKSLNRALEYAEDAKRQYSTISLVSPGARARSIARFWVEAPYAEYYYEQAGLETNLSKRRELLEKAMEAMPDLMSRAEKSGFFSRIWYTHHVVSKVLTSQATMETNSEGKKRLLEKALEHRNKTIRYQDQAPFFYWDHGLMMIYLARTKSELARLTKDLASEKNMLQEAAVDVEKGLKLCAKSLASEERRGIVLSARAALSSWQYEYGNLLKRLYDITRSREYLMKAIEAFEDSAESAQKLDLIGRVAESNWKIAQMYDALGKNLKAAESFTLASNNYKSAAEKIAQLKDFYLSHAVYMQAWSDIEKARQHHKSQEYGSAKECYESAAAMHKSLKQWSYLAPNYSAWAQVENAEDLSRREKSGEALQAFERAAKLFSETKTSIQTELNKIENTDEKQMATIMVKATDLRQEYCTGRISIEKAKILDKRGYHYSSSERYDLAAQTFEKMTGALESEHDRKELKLITTLSRAWEKMMLAEARASPELYMEASQLFEQASQLSSSEKTSFLTLGHSRFCKALGAGTKFADTGDAALNTVAIQQLESATKYYVNAGFQEASEYAKGTKLLFDAYVHMDDAKEDKDPEKKARLYAMAEKVLQSSAGAYMKAKHPEKREQVLRLLEEVKENRELALSLTEVLHAPSIVSATTSFLTPTPTHEEAVGLERFEHANIQAYLDAPKEVVVGETFEVRLDMANVAKEPGLLVRMENLVPSHFKVTETVPRFKLENGIVDMKGKRLEPQKVESMRIRVSTQQSGISHINPRIVYVDEAGKFNVCQPDPAAIAIYPPGKFQFETNNAQKVFEYLTKAFVEDYMKKRLPVERSGWRTLMQIVTSGKTSKLSIYGTKAHRGTAMSELESRGVVEVRIFPGERGRGGQITKARVAYERDVIKRHIDEQVLKIREK